MTVTYDLYGARCLCLLQAKVHAENSLGVSFEERNSTYQGGSYYISGNRGEENFILKLNLDSFDEEPVEQDFSDFSVLLYINATTRSSDIERAIRDGGGFELLRHEVF